MEIWHCFIGQPPRGYIIDALNQARLHSHACESPPPNGPGIIFFDEINSQLIELLRTASRQGTERVLAIGLSQPAMKANGIWNLLRAGASDVFAWDHSREPAAEIAAKFEHWQKVDEIIQSPLASHSSLGHLQLLSVLSVPISSVSI